MFCGINIIHSLCELKGSKWDVMMMGVVLNLNATDL